MNLGKAEYLAEGAKGVKVAVFIAIPLDIFKELLADRFSWTHLSAEIVCDSIGALIAEGAATLVGVLLVSGAAPVIVVGILSLVAATLAVSVWNAANSYFKIDQKMQHFAQRCIVAIEDGGSAAFHEWQQLEKSDSIAGDIVRQQDYVFEGLYFMGRSALKAVIE